jgi:hypothetical protein
MRATPASFVVVITTLFSAGTATAQPAPSPAQVPAATTKDDPAITGVPDAIGYKPGRWVTFRATRKTKVRMRMLLQPMMRYGHASGGADDTVDLILRRARLGFDANLPDHLGMRFELSVKNMHSEIHNMYVSWTPQKHLELQFGFIKAPGGLERDSFSFDQPFIERSVVTFLNYDHEVGLKVTQVLCGGLWRWAAAIARNPPPLEGGDPEDTPAIPTGVEAEDLTRPASKWNASARLVATPGDHVATGVRTGVRLRPEEPDFGEIAVEPYDTTFLTNRPYRGLWTSASADLALAQRHWRMLAEGGFRRDGVQLAYPTGDITSETELDGHLWAACGYLVFGFTPDGHYGPAVDAAPLEDGWEIVTRVQGSYVKPVDDPDPDAHGDAATLAMVEGGVHWEASQRLRLQADVAIEKFGNNDVTLLNENKNATRVWAQVWATVRL